MSLEWTMHNNWWNQNPIFFTIFLKSPLWILNSVFVLFHMQMSYCVSIKTTKKNNKFFNVQMIYFFFFRNQHQYSNVYWQSKSANQTLMILTCWLKSAGKSFGIMGQNGCFTLTPEEWYNYNSDDIGMWASIYMLLLFLVLQMSNTIVLVMMVIGFHEFLRCGSHF